MKKVILSIIGAIVVVLLVAFNHYTRVYFDNNNAILKNLNLLKQKDLRLNYEIFMISEYLYKDFDSIVKLEKEINQILQNLKQDKEFQAKKQTYKAFLNYKKAIQNKINRIYEVETLIAPLKNADMYILELLTKIPKQNLSKQNSQILLDITADVFRAKSSLDMGFVNSLSLNFNKLDNYKNIKFNNIFYKNIDLINSLFVSYVKNMNQILYSNTDRLLKECFDKFLIETNNKLKIITIVSVLLILFVIASIIFIMFLFVKLEQENKLLEKMTITDKLTSMNNRHKLELDIENFDGVLFIINIDRFKYYNDLYGIKVGDFVLQQTALFLSKALKNYKVKVYRIGGDDFGVLFEKTINIKKTADLIVEYFKEHKIKYQDLEFNVSVSIGISSEKPLIETADIALKTLKKDKKNNYAIYNIKLHQKEIIKDNFEKTNILKQAIKTDNIIPYFQPIVSNKTGKIIKYEVLARVKTNEEIYSIYPFLVIAKENKVYKNITQSIYQKAFKKFENKNIEFSLNISIDDINDEETMTFIYELMDKHKDMMKYVTFEILEDDAINDYSALKDFIVLVKSKGAKIAIDDFGSGYSNFGHVLNLDIDYLKIDGSLIKNLDNDDKMRLIVETIIDFSQKTNIKTIAEFVHNKEVYEKVKSLGVDYSQGFYLYEPREIIY